MQRVAIVGCPGSGKTTFARQLAKETGLPLIHLDYYYHDTSKQYYTDKAAWREKMQQTVADDKWIIDGNYKSTFDIRFPRADTIIFLDYPRRVVLWHSLKRRVYYHNKRRPDMPASWREKVSYGYLRFVWNFQKTERSRIQRLLDEHQSHAKVLTITHPRQLAKLFD